jgi:hypothetical protein
MPLPTSYAQLPLPLPYTQLPLPFPTTPTTPTEDDPKHINMYKLSHRAANNLTRISQTYGYVHPNALKLRGLALFVTALSHLQYDDTRPSIISDQDLPLADAGEWPEWDLDIPSNDRRSIGMQLTTATHARFQAIAIRHLIQTRASQLRYGPILATSGTTQRVLEAIGLGWLTPAPATPIPHLPPSQRPNTWARDSTSPGAKPPTNRKYTELDF